MRHNAKQITVGIIDCFHFHNETYYILRVKHEIPLIIQVCNYYK